MSELNLKFGEREIVLTKLLGTYWSGSISLAEYDGAWIATLYYSACHDQTGDYPAPQAALDALAEKVRGHIQELQGLLQAEDPIGTIRYSKERDLRLEIKRESGWELLPTNYPEAKP